MDKRGILLVMAAACAAIAACSAGTVATTTRPTPSSTVAPSEPTEGAVITLAAEPQREGDPAKGRWALLNAPYVPCGIPMKAFDTYQRMGGAGAVVTVEGREGVNAKLPLGFTAMTTKEGVELATSNCLTCHAGRIGDQTIVGLGAADSDFTADAESLRSMAAAVGYLVQTDAERAEWLKWKGRFDVVAPYSVLHTRGPNPADAFTAVLFAHHDPKTLAWSDTPLLDVPPPQDAPVDVPPLWRMKKKTSMFAIGAGRGDHARIMMAASLLCTSSVEESRTIDAWFGDIRAYFTSLVPPAYPYPIDRPLADRGRVVFEANCARCHGTYGPEGHYPNRVLPLAEIGTDALIASGTAQFAGAYVDWFGKSFFGETARLEPQAGYVAPPLDGVWATAPFLHNGSVPTLEALLDSARRPTYWTRSFDPKDYDPAAVGWRFTVVDHGKAGEPTEAGQKALYDTTLVGYSKAGHTFGDKLLEAERRAVIEYVKTL